MSRAVNPEQLGEALERELTLYSQEVTNAVDDAGSRAIKKLVTLTRASAPVGYRGSFKRSISSKADKGARGTRYTWYVKPPNHRLTHLLVHGHATKSGGRTRANSFLRSSLNEVLPEYEKDVEEAIKNG